MTYGTYAVTAFIVISGWSLMLVVLRRREFDVVSFAKGRARRLLPPYYAALALGVVAGHTFLDSPKGTVWTLALPPADPGSVIKQALLVQDVLPTHLANYVLWSIAVEVHVYLIFPWVVAAWRRSRLPVLAVGLLLVAYGLQVATSSGLVGRLHPQFYAFFALGALACVLGEKPPPWLKGSWCVGGALTLLLSLCLLNELLGEAGAMRRLTYTQVFVALIACLVLSAGALGRLRWLSTAPLVAIGLVSYSLYLTHAVVVESLWRYAVEPLGLHGAVRWGVLLLAGLGCGIAVAWILYRLVERPSLSKATRASHRDEARRMLHQPLGAVKDSGVALQADGRS